MSLYLGSPVALVHQHDPALLVVCGSRKPVRASLIDSPSNAMSNGPHLGDLSPAGSIAVSALVVVTLSRFYADTVLSQLGVVVGLASTCIQSIGLTLQRKSHLLEDVKRDNYTHVPDASNPAIQVNDANPYRPPYRRRRWQIGMAMFIISNLVGSTIQITTLPLPVLSTLQASGLVFNTFCASLLLHEPFTRLSFLGTALIAGGAVLIALFGALAEPSHNLKQLLVLLARTQFILWMFGTFLIIGAVLIGMFFLRKLHPHPHSHTVRVARGFAFGGISAILSAHSLLVAKSAVELLVRTIVDKRNQFNRWESWLILLLLVFFALTQLYFLHRGLKLVSTSILYPFVFCVYNIIAILDGLIYFRQTDRISPLHGGLIALGTFVLLSGVVALSWRIDESRESAPPPDAHTFLTPGMGIVEDVTTEDERDTDIDDDNASTTSADDEQQLAPSEVTPLIDKSMTTLSNAKRGSLFVTKPRRQALIKDDIESRIPTNEDVHGTDGNKPALATLHTHFSSSSLSPNHRKHTRNHKRVRSAVEASTPALSSRHSSPSPPRPNGGLSRASTVHAASDFQGPVHSLTWRERDREIRRHRWPKRVNTLIQGRAERGRSASSPLARRKGWRESPISAGPDSSVFQSASQCQADRSLRGRVGSISAWIGRLFTGPKFEAEDTPYESNNHQR